MDQRSLDPERFDAVLFDLDGVLTETATLHGRAWKQMFDEYLEERAKRLDEPFAPFTDADYRTYVDGKPRYDGVRSFLISRGIELAEGDPTDSPGADTVAGLGNRKNELVVKLIADEGVQPFPGALRLIEKLRANGVKTAVVSSSKNAALVLEVAGIADEFDTRVDGSVAAELGLRGKPAPDTFLEAAHRLGALADRSVVVEDAISGVQAGAAGGFGLVVGVGSPEQAKALLDNGADVVVGDLAELIAGAP